MKNKLYLTFLVLISFAFNSCSDDDNSNQNLNGAYIGTFTVEYLDGQTFTNPVTVTFTGENNYNSSGNSDYFPAGGSGTYERKNAAISFSDIDYWTANFDWNLILGGEYEYSINGNNLTMSANRSAFGTYTYKLTKD